MSSSTWLEAAMYKGYLFIKRGIVTMLSYRTALVLGIVGSFIGLLQFSFMGRFLTEGNSFPALNAYGGNLLAYLIIGTAFTSFVGVSLGSFQNTIRSEQQMGTLEYLLITNTKLELLLSYSGLVSFLGTLLNVTLLLLVVIFVFDIPMEVNLAGAAVCILLTITSLSGIGLMGAGIIMVTKVGDPVTWIFTTLTGLLSGVLFPVEYLPGALKAISMLLPTTHALHALRLTLTQNASIEQISSQLLFLLIASAITVPLGFFSIRAGFNKARRDGTLAHY
ncbi:MAG: ABC transporter permease [candidate division Zixibacteria bacterium]|nr:ABC transporter permease [candidate division Zixibacteria bacterium]MBU1470096.1 ABC transporter permease [candidate division Zixibacteria bacterium]MBU2624416.1 ABC transporter permease [candidate division Zixibacteria bacterium]